MSQDTHYVPPPPAPPVAPRPPLRRSETDRVLAGVAGGIARWLGIDPVIVRVILVVLAVFGGSGLLIYVIGWLFIPSESEQASEADKFIRSTRSTNSASRIFLIVILSAVAVLLGLGLLTAVASGGLYGHWGGGGSLLLLGVIIALVVFLARRPGSTGSAGTPVAPPMATNADQLAPTATTSVEAPVGYELIEPAPVYAAAATDTSQAFAYGGSGQYPGYVPTPAPEPRAPKQRSYLGLATLSVAIIVTGILASLSAAGSGNIPVVVVLASALGILGVGLLIGAFAGRARWLVFLAVPLLLVTSVAAAIPHDLERRLGNGVGERSWAPATIYDLPSEYQLGVGTANLYLTQMQAPSNSISSVLMTVGLGQIRVTVPQNMRVFITSSVNAGSVSVYEISRITSPGVTGYESTTVFNKSGRNVSASLAMPNNPATGPIVKLVLNVSVGSVEVDREPASN